jgi:putative ABC transport system ATP-binding protein
MEAKTILIVEDDDAGRSAMEKVLQSHNYKTFSCASGKHALVKLKEKVFGILITDFQMRGMDGLELIRGARGIHPGISTILVTGLATEELRVRVNEQGVNRFFPKPIEWDELIRYLDALNGEEKGFDTDQRQKAMEHDSKGAEYMDLIVAENITKDYHLGEVTVSALKGASFNIEPASFVSFVGPSGSGKTTLLNLIGCLDKPAAGRLLVAGMDVSSFGKRDSAIFRGKNIGFIFQDFNLIPVLTVFENIEYPLLMVQNGAPGDRKTRVMNLLEAVGMTEQKDKYPDQISGGQKQRVAVARALVTNPKLVLADEPTANLDHKTAYMVIELMKKMRDELKTTFIFSTHDQKIVGEAEILYMLEDGELVNKQMKGGENHA